MVFKSARTLLFLAGGVVVVICGLYVTGAFDALFADRNQIVSSPAPQAAGQPATSANSEPAPANAGKADTPQQAAAASGSTTPPPAGERQSGLIVPTFDLVRVEPNGSVVIAGHAAPNSKVEVISGATVIGSDTANESGDFAVVLDNPLKPGDYTIVLRATSPSSIAATSEETAVVSVPENVAGQVLALVEKPGAPSRLVTVPEAEDTAGKQDRPVAEQSTKLPSEQQAAAVASDGSGADKLVQDRDQSPVASSAASTAAPAARDEKPVTAAEKPRITVEAVEIEGGRVFVAGKADPDASVRVYANEILLGDAKVSPGGQFLVEADRELPVGDYIVRADLLGPGGEVVARAAVPFQREPGEAIAAVASPQSGGNPRGAESSEAKTQSEAAVAPQGAAGQPDNSQREASGDSAVLSNEGEKPSTDESEPSTDVTAPKLQNVAGSVIIRRGDSLWRISRRVYGRGVRYTTIYLANQDQIENPDRIWPGQVFSVPDQTGDGVKADMSTVRDRAAPKP